MSDSLSKKIALQRAALVGEWLWRALQKPVLAAGIAYCVIASGLLELLPHVLQLACLAILIMAFVFTLKDLLKLKMPKRIEAMRHLEAASAIDHRAISSLDDELSVETKNPDAEMLWEEHQRRQLLRLTTVRIAPPKSAWRRFDPLAIRVPVALAVIATGLLGSGGLSSTVGAALNFAPPALPQALTFDAWLKPPAYTGRPPLLLTSKAMQDTLASGTDVLVPDNTTLTLRVQGAEHPRLAFYSLGTPASAETEIKTITARMIAGESGFSTDVKLDRPALIKLFDGKTELASWPVTLIHDEPPQLKITGGPQPEKRGALNVGWEASDDYGVKTITADISLSDEQEGGMGFENNGVFLFDAPEFRISLKKPNAKSEMGNTTQDLSAHPWAGLFVEMTLTATDGAGQSVTTPPARFKMPARDFFKPLAKALIEQRGKLILSPDEAPNVATMLDAMLAYPYSIREKSRLILNLAAIKSALFNAGDTDTVSRAISELWPLAVAIEEGEMADARAELKALKQQLEQALRDGAPPERIAELMDRMRKAMDRLLTQMQKEAEKRQAENGQSKQNGRSITKQDLQKMLDQIEKLSKDGSKDAAEQMLSELDKLLQNLEPGGTEQSQGGDPGLQQKMDELSDVMKRQQQLMDETQRMSPNGEGEGDQPGSPGSKGKGSKGNALSDRQGKLGERLDRLNRDMGGGSDNFGDAPENMKGAQGSLREGSSEEALRQQGQAMKDLQKGAEKIGKKLAQQGQGKTGEQGKDGEAGGQNDDPLGRPRASRSPDTGPNKNTVPSELAMRRAREILQQLRNRTNDEGLSETQRAYIERLLKGLY